MALRPALVLALLIALAAALAVPAGAVASGSGAGSLGPTEPVPPALTRALADGMRAAGAYSSADVVDLTTGAQLYGLKANVARIPASVEKLWTTSTALELYGDGAKLATTVLGAGRLAGSTYEGALYLRGGGDPTFGSAGFDHSAYGTGATVQGLVSKLRAAGIKRITGPIVADGSWFDGDQGTPATGNRPSVYVEGALGGLTFNRDWSDADGSTYYPHPALQAGDQLALALRAAGVALPRHVVVTTGRTPSAAQTLATVHSPTMAKLVQLTNTPSDDFFAETLLKDLGAQFGAGGTTSAGAAVVRSQIAKEFGLHPHLIDGSGLAYRDRTSPEQVVSLLSQQRDNTTFRNSLAIAGETGTLVDEMNHTVAQGQCSGKTGTLSDVSNLVGYCTAANGHTIAFAFLMNGVDPDAAHPIQDRMVEAIARSQG